MFLRYYYRMVTFYNITLSTAFSLLMLSVAEAARPNVVLINADDLGWAEVGCYGQKKIKTPNIDKLASEGQRWVYFYSGAPVCSPSRNVLMTGKHTGNCDVQDLKRVDAGENWRDLKGDWPIRTETYTLPEAMKKAGYATAVFGKWGIGDFGSTGAPDKHGVDRFYGYTDQKACHTYYPPYLWNDGKKEVLNTSLTAANIGHGSHPKGEVLADTYRAEQHSSDLIADKMLEFVKEKAHGKQPFFLYYAPLEPHVAMQPLQEWIDRYPREWDKSPYRGNRGYLPHPRPRAAYAGMISQMDHTVGRLLDTLKACGLDKNTIVIFTSDNGTTHDAGGVDHRFFNSVADLKGLKGQLYEGGIRVPGIIRWPGKIAPGKTITQLTAQGKLPLVVGGTGLYITSLLNGIGFTPEKVDPAIRQELQARLQAEGSQALYAELAAVDPGYAAKVHPNNTPRVIRALELYRATGRKMSAEREAARPAEKPYCSLCLCLTCRDRTLLYQRIDTRCDRMMQSGILEEAKLVYDHRDTYRTAAQAIGYKEFFPYFEGTADLESCLAHLKQASRNYAKRQLTWFRRQTDAVWLYLEDENLEQQAAEQTEAFLAENNA